MDFLAGGEGTNSDSGRNRLGWRVVGCGSAIDRGRGYLAGGGGVHLRTSGVMISCLPSVVPR